jgi:hypothetical protein
VRIFLQISAKNCLYRRVCCRSPIIPARPSYSAELMSLSYSGSLPRSSGTSGSAPDLSSVPDHALASPLTDVWTNPLNGTVRKINLIFFGSAPDLSSVPDQHALVAAHGRLDQSTKRNGKKIFNFIFFVSAPDHNLTEIWPRRNLNGTVIRFSPNLFFTISISRP